MSLNNNNVTVRAFWNWTSISLALDEEDELQKSLSESSWDMSINVSVLTVFSIGIVSVIVLFVVLRYETTQKMCRFSFKSN